MARPVCILKTIADGNEKDLLDLFPTDVGFEVRIIEITEKYPPAVKDCRYIQLALEKCKEANPSSDAIIIQNDVSTNLCYEDIQRILTEIESFDQDYYFIILGGWGQDCSAFRTKTTGKILPIKSAAGINALIVSPAGREFLSKKWTPAECLAADFAPLLFELLEDAGQSHMIFSYHPWLFEHKITLVENEEDAMKLSRCWITRTESSRQSSRSRRRSSTPSTRTKGTTSLKSTTTRSGSCRADKSWVWILLFILVVLGVGGGLVATN